MIIWQHLNETPSTSKDIQNKKININNKYFSVQDNGDC